MGLTMAAPTLIISLTALFLAAFAQKTCLKPLTPSYAATVASGYRIGLVATGLARPRGILFDKAGHLLVVEAPKNGDPAISALSLNDGGGICVGEASRKTVVRGQGVSGPLFSKHAQPHAWFRRIMESPFLVTEPFSMHHPWILHCLGSTIQQHNQLRISVPW